MSTRPETIAYLTEQMAGAGLIRFRPMFGEYGVYLDEKLVGLVADDSLFIKKTDPGDRLVGPGHDAPPYPGAKPSLCIPAEKLQDVNWLRDLVRATADALPTPKPKKKRG